MTKNTVTLALIQMSASGDPQANLRKAASRVRQAAEKGAQIVCLQELFRSLYFCREYDRRHFALSESIPGPTTEFFSKLAAREKIVIIAPVFEKRADGVYHNSAAVIDTDGTLAGHYRKMHIPDDPNFYEKYYFTPGDLGFKTVQTKFAKIAVLICWDQWFPEAARIAALGGAQILFYPTAIGRQKGETSKTVRAQYEGWEVVQRGHAAANEVFVAVTNRVGKEGPVTFWGQSFVSDPFGSLVAQADAKKEENLMVRCDLSRIEEVRQNWPFLRDRRIDAYGEITRRFLDKGKADPRVPPSKSNRRAGTSAGPYK